MKVARGILKANFGVCRGDLLCDGSEGSTMAGCSWDLGEGERDWGGESGKMHCGVLGEELQVGRMRDTVFV